MLYGILTFFNGFVDYKIKHVLNWKNIRKCLYPYVGKFLDRLMPLHNGIGRYHKILSLTSSSRVQSGLRTASLIIQHKWIFTFPCKFVSFTSTSWLLCEQVKVQWFKLLNDQFHIVSLRLFVFRCSRSFSRSNTSGCAMGSTTLTPFPFVSYRRPRVAVRKQIISYADVPLLR